MKKKNFCERVDVLYALVLHRPYSTVQYVKFLNEKKENINFKLLFWFGGRKERMGGWVEGIYSLFLLLLLLRLGTAAHNSWPWHATTSKRPFSPSFVWWRRRRQRRHSWLAAMTKTTATVSISLPPQFFHPLLLLLLLFAAYLLLSNCRTVQQHSTAVQWYDDAAHFFLYFLQCALLFQNEMII